MVIVWHTRDEEAEWKASINQFTELFVEQRRVTLRQLDQNGQLIDQILITK